MVRYAVGKSRYRSESADYHGQIFGFLYPNGTGKTTTIKTMCGVSIPDTESVKLLGHDVQRNRGAAMQQSGVVLVDRASITYWGLSAVENLTNFGRLKGLRDRYLKRKVEQLQKELSSPIVCPSAV